MLFSSIGVLSYVVLAAIVTTGFSGAARMSLASKLLFGGILWGLPIYFIAVLVKNYEKVE